MNLQEVLDEQFDRAWDAGVTAAWVVVREVLGSGADLNAIKRRFIDRRHEGSGTMGIAAKHVQTGTGRRQQQHIPRLCHRKALMHGLLD